jgi:HSP20 family protein
MVRPSPWRRELPAPFHVLQTELNRFLEDYLNPSTRLTPASGEATDLDATGWTPAIDVFETPEAIVVLAEVPGVEPSAIDLSVTGNILSLRGSKVTDKLPEGHHPVRERRFGTFHRQITLSVDVDFEATQAEARNGVLKIRLPKQKAAQPRTIPVQPA